MNRSILSNAVDPASQHRLASLDVFRTITKSLRYLDFKTTLFDMGYFSIHSVSTSGVEFKPQGTNIGSVDQRLVQGVPVDRPPFHSQGVWIDCLEEPGLSDQHRRPRSAGLVRCADQ